MQTLVVAIYKEGCLTGAALIIIFDDELGQQRALLIKDSWSLVQVLLVGAVTLAPSTTMWQS